MLDGIISLYRERVPGRVALVGGVLTPPWVLGAHEVERGQGAALSE